MKERAVENWKIQQGQSPNVVFCDIPDGEAWILLRSDAHHDNPDCNQELEKKHLDEAIKYGAGIIDCGDLFCAMQGKYDKRSDKSKVRPEHQGGDYLDRLVATAADFYAPYAQNFIAIGTGNHETAILKRHETNLTERLAERLREKTGAPVLTTGYTGWIRFRMARAGTKLSISNFNLWHMHGYGGGGPITVDTIQGQRQRSYIEGADMIVTGHTHDCWAQQSMKIMCDTHGMVHQKAVWNVKCPTYKDEYKTGAGGWHIETGKPPKPLGAWWLHLTVERRRKRGMPEHQWVDCEVIKAD